MMILMPVGNVMVPLFIPSGSDHEPEMPGWLAMVMLVFMVAALAFVVAVMCEMFIL